MNALRSAVARGRRASCAALALAAVAVVPASALGANPGTATTTTGQPLNIRIDAPSDGAAVAAQALTVNGVAGIGPLTGSGATNLMYIIDNSGSTSSIVGDCNGDGTTDANDDLNGDKAIGNVLDCEISGGVALNTSLAQSGIQAGAIAFGSTSDQGDVTPAAGQQDFAAVSADANGNGRSDVEDVLRSINGGGFGLFTPTTGSGGGTNFNGAITKLNTAFAAKAGQRNIAAFLSDGSDSITEGAGSPVDTARAAGTRINTYSVGKSAVGCGATSALKKIADITGGTCTEVLDPTKLSATISGGAGAGLQGVTVSVNGGAATAAAVTALGNWSLRLAASRLRSGSNRILAKVTASDGTVANAEVTVNVGAGATPATAIGLPSSKKCISKRMFPIRVRQVRGLRYDFATIVVNGKKVRVYVRSGKRWIRTGRPSGKVLNVRVFTAFVDLRGKVKGRYSVKIVVVATNGRVITGKRTYRTCSRRLTGSVPKL